MNLFVLWTESFGESLKVSNLLASGGGHLLDCSVIGRWSQVLVHFDQPPADKALLSPKLSAPHKKTWLPEIKDQIVESYLSLCTHKVSDFLLSIETSFIGDVFKFLQIINLEQFPIVDLRLLRFNEPKVLLLLTGSGQDSDQLLIIMENLKALGEINFQFELVMPVQTAIKDLFHYSGK